MRWALSPCFRAHGHEGKQPTAPCCATDTRRGVMVIGPHKVPESSERKGEGYWLATAAHVNSCSIPTVTQGYQGKSTKIKIPPQRPPPTSQVGMLRHIFQFRSFILSGHLGINRADTDGVDGSMGFASNLGKVPVRPS